MAVSITVSDAARSPRSYARVIAVVMIVGGLAFSFSLLPIMNVTPVSQTVSVCQVSESEEHWYHYLGLWWDDRTIGTLCDKTPGFGYSWADDRGNITVNTTDFDDSVCMMFNKTQSGTGGIDATFTRDFEGYWQFSTQMATTASGAELGFWLVNGSTLLLGIGFAGGQIYVWDGASVNHQAHALDTWYDFDLRVSTVNDTYQAYLNGTLLEGNPLNPAAGNVSKVTGIWYRMGTAITGVAYADDFQIWGRATYDYQSDELYAELIDGLDYVYDTLYQPGYSGELSGTSPVTGYEWEANMSYPRVSKGYVMDAAIKAYELTLQAKYYNMAIDLGRWLDDVAQQPAGWFSFTGGTVPNYPNNVLTSMECAASLIRLYELTHDTRWLDSATEALDFQIENSWNSTLGLFNDAPGSAFVRTNLNTAAARCLAYAYYVTGDLAYGDKSAAILSNLAAYQHPGNPDKGDSGENYSGCGYYSLFVENSDWQGWSYESFTTSGYAMAVYYLNKTGDYAAQIDGWMDTLRPTVFTILLNSPSYGMITNVSTHNYLESWVGLGYYNLMAQGEAGIFLDAWYSMAEYCTDRAVVLLSDSAFIPANQNYNEPTYYLGAFTAIGQIFAMWDFAELPNFGQPYQLSLNSTARLLITGVATIHDLAQSGQELTWTTDTSGVVAYSIIGLSGEVGYKVYQDGDVIATGGGPSFSFTATGGGEFEIVVWHSKEVSAMVVLTVNLIGLGIVVSVIAGFVIPFSRDIKAGRGIKTEKALKDLVKTVIFIIIALIMWGLLHQIAIG